MHSTWRLIPPIEASGFEQMAIDEWLLEQHRIGQGLPCLRFYTWNPVAISLGYHQRTYPEAWDSLVWAGQSVDIVRRPSGGRAVLHQGDLTYSLVVSQLNGRRRDIYQFLCEFLIVGWQSLGVRLQLGRDNRRYHRAVNCFGASTSADLVMVDGYKLIGSAQLYRDGCILQHGSIRLRPEPDLCRLVFGQLLEPPKDLVRITHADVVAGLLEAAKQVFNIKFESIPLSRQELTQAMDWARVRDIG